MLNRNCFALSNGGSSIATTTHDHYDQHITMSNRDNANDYLNADHGTICDINYDDETSEMMTSITIKIQTSIVWTITSIAVATLVIATMVTVNHNC